MSFGNYWHERALAAEAEVERLRAKSGVSTPTTISLIDPAVIIAGIRQFGLASDGSDLRDLEAAIERLRTALRLFVRCAYPVATEITPRGHDWLPEKNLDYALGEARRILGADNAVR